MKLNLIVYKEAHIRANGKSIERPPLKEEIGIYKCRMVCPSESRMCDVSAGSIRTLRSKITEKMAGMPEGTQVESICCSPPEDAEPRQFIKVRQGVRLLGEDGKPLDRRYDSSGTLMVAKPLPLDENERREFEAAASD